MVEIGTFGVVILSICGTISFAAIVILIAAIYYGTKQK